MNKAPPPPLRLLKPGSLTPSGYIVDIDRQVHILGPAIVPRDLGATRLHHDTARGRLAYAAGWRNCPAALQPRILDHGELCIIQCDHPDYKRWDALPRERKRAGAGR